MAFTLAQLRLVLAIHEHGSLGKVRSVLNLTQPALSRNLRELETQLGVPLFERHPSGLRATQFCHAILPYAANMIEEAERALEEIRILTGKSQQTIRIGTLAVGSVALLPALIGGLLEEAPGIRFKVIEGNNEVLVAGLKARELDLIISGGTQDDDELFLALDLGLETACTLLVGEDHPLLHHEDRSMARIIGQRWAMQPHDSKLRNDFERIIRERCLPTPTPLVETRSTNLIRRLVAQHRFVAWGPPLLYVSNEPGAKVVALDVPEFTLQASFSVYHRRRGVKSSAMCRTLSILQRLAASEFVPDSGWSASSDGDDTTTVAA